MLVATDLDGVLDRKDDFDPVPTICISGRTWQEYDGRCKIVAARMPLFIRGIGEYGDRMHAGFFKALMIRALGVTVYYEDDPIQCEIIKQNCPDVDLRQV